VSGAARAYGGQVVLKWIVGSKVDHPLADPKQAKALVAELPPHDYAKALEEITGWLESLNETEGFKLDRLLEIAELLDSASKNHQRKLLQDYLNMSRQQKFQENKLWTSGFRLSKGFGDLYMSGVRQYQAGASGAAAVKKQMPVVVARAMRTLAMQVKWTMLRYGPFSTQLWSSIGELYRFAAKSGFAETPLTIYPGTQGTGTVQQEFLRVLMLWASSADVLPPLKQEIAERAIAHFSKFFKLGSAPFPGSLYVFDPARDKPPGRLFGNPPAGTDLTFFGPGEAPPKLQEVIGIVEQTGGLPSTVNLGALYPTDTILSVLRHLAVYWSDKPPARASERRATSARITIVPGYFALLDELERDETDALNFSVSSAESWVVENVSDNGYGALVPAAATDWLRVGEMIGVQVEGTAQWGIGIVRRVSRDDQRQHHVGIEIISRSVTMVRISQGEAAREGENAVLLAGAPDGNGEIGMVMRAGRYDPNANIEITGRTKSYTFLPSRMMDAGDDFDWAMFTIANA
jgi:hypothetical protein